MLTKIVVFLTVVNLLVFSSALEDKHEVSFTFGYYKRPLLCCRHTPPTMFCCVPYSFTNITQNRCCFVFKFVLPQNNRIANHGQKGVNV